MLITCNYKPGFVELARKEDLLKVASRTVGVINAYLRKIRKKSSILNHAKL